MILFGRFLTKCVEVFASGIEARFDLFTQGMGWVMVGSSAFGLLNLFLRDNAETEKSESEILLDDMRSKFENIFEATKMKNAFGMKPKLVTLIKNSLGTSYMLKLPVGLTLDDAIKVKDVIQNELKYKVTLTNNYDRVFIQTIEYPLGDMYELKKHTEKIPQDKDKASFVLGVIKDEHGEQYPVLNLTTAFCHLLIAGVNGSGKSGCLKNIFAQLARKDIDTWILDMKRGVETRMLEDVQCVKRYEYRTERAPKFIAMLNKVMQHRYDTMGNAKCKDYTDYNKKHPDTPIKPLVVLIEELSDLNRLYPNASDELRSIMMMARAANISVIATIQRPDSKMLDSGSKSQFQNRISFKQVDEINSNIALGNNLAVEMLKGEPIGRGIVQTEQLVDKMFQSFYIEDEDLLCFLKDKMKVKDSKESRHVENIEDATDDVIGEGRVIAIKRAIQNDVKLNNIKCTTPTPKIKVKKQNPKNSVIDIDEMITKKKTSIEENLIFNN